MAGWFHGEGRRLSADVPTARREQHVESSHVMGEGWCSYSSGPALLPTPSCVQQRTFHAPLKATDFFPGFLFLRKLG